MSITLIVAAVTFIAVYREGSKMREAGAEKAPSKFGQFASASSAAVIFGIITSFGVSAFEPNHSCYSKVVTGMYTAAESIANYDVKIVSVVEQKMIGENINALVEVKYQNGFGAWQKPQKAWGQFDGASCAMIDFKLL